MGRQAKELGPLAGDKCRDMGLGGFPDVSLAGAREAAREARAKVRDGVDPLSLRSARVGRSLMLSSRLQAEGFSQAPCPKFRAHALVCCKRNACLFTCSARLSRSLSSLWQVFHR